MHMTSHEIQILSREYHDKTITAKTRVSWYVRWEVRRDGEIVLERPDMPLCDVSWDMDKAHATKLAKLLVQEGFTGVYISNDGFCGKKQVSSFIHFSKSWEEIHGVGMYASPVAQSAAPKVTVAHYVSAHNAEITAEVTEIVDGNVYYRIFRNGQFIDENDMHEADFYARYDEVRPVADDGVMFVD